MSQNGYNLPKPGEQSEHERLDIQHQMWIQTLDGLFTSPIDDSVQNVLDIGCGPGAWTKDVASKFPKAKLVRLDLNPPSSSATTPANVSYMSGNVEEDETFEALKAHADFDFVFGRCLVLGGWLESCDIYLDIKSDDASVDDSPVLQWSRHLFDGTYALGCDPTIGGLDSITPTLKKLGFTDLHQYEATWPVGGSETGEYQWPSEDQRRFAALCTVDVGAFMAAATAKVLPFSPSLHGQDPQQILREAKLELESGHSRRYYFKLTSKSARKPM
ncbi:MAG: hypothetical protein Q9159_007340 [Coniocarpon cinnabarinum]